MTTLDMTRGESRAWNIPVTLSGAADPIGAADTVTWAAAARPGDDPLIEKTRAGGIVVVNASQGSLQLQLDPADTAAFPTDRDTVLEWDCWLTQSGTTTNIASGDMIVRAAVGA